MRKLVIGDDECGEVRFESLWRFELIRYIDENSVDLEKLRDKIWVLDCDTMSPELSLFVRSLVSHLAIKKGSV
jgi:hypothetical protein